jgi:hypothetical protein
MRRKERVRERELVARDVRPDSRRRVSLGAALADVEDETSFDVYREANGRIVLEPKVSIPAEEVWLYRNKKALASVRRGLAEFAAGDRGVAISFAEYLDDDES